MKAWSFLPPVDVSEALRTAVGGHPLIAASIARRGFTTPAAAERFLDPATYTLTPPDALPDLDRAVDRLRTALSRGERILVWGDFDVDGQTSTALLVSALRDLGGKVDYYIPNRLTEGHGIALPSLLPRLSGVDVLLTCDTGIAAHEAVDAARARGVSVLITDHHALPPTLPAADAVVNPMRLPPGHPLRELPGVGTAYQVMRALYGSRSTDHLLDLVAVGIVADVMVQVDDTRALLQRGLALLREARRPALRALLERAEIDPANLTEMDIGFALAPRLNALGRLADANPAVELLTTSDPAIIAERVNELEGLNQQRRFLTRQVYAAAQQQIAEDPALLKYSALIVHGAGWHTGVVGIVASRLVEDYGKPTLVLSESDGILSGSARSVAGCNLIEAIGSQRDRLLRWGGHAMAAGLSLRREDLIDVQRGLSFAVREALAVTDAEPRLTLDGEIRLAEIDLDFADDIARLAPFGNGNPPLTLCSRGLTLQSRRTLGSRGDHLELRVRDDEGIERRVLWWFGDANALPAGRFDLAYTVRANTFNGRRDALIEWIDARPAADVVTVSTEPSYAFVDARDEHDPAGRLTRIFASYADVLIWREGLAERQRLTAAEGVDRLHLRPAATLLMWTPPPDPLTWQAILQTVQPQTLIACAQPTPLDDRAALLTLVSGLLKTIIRQRAGQISLIELAARCAHTPQTMRACLAALAARGLFSVTPQSEDRLLITLGPQSAASGTMPEDTLLERHLAETRAYRAHWRTRPRL